MKDILTHAFDLLSAPWEIVATTKIINRYLGVTISCSNDVLKIHRNHSTFS